MEALGGVGIDGNWPVQTIVIYKALGFGVMQMWLQLVVTRACLINAEWGSGVEPQAGNPDAPIDMNPDSLVAVNVKASPVSVLPMQPVMQVLITDLPQAPTMAPHTSLWAPSGSLFSSPPPR